LAESKRRLAFLLKCLVFTWSYAALTFIHLVVLNSTSSASSTSTAHFTCAIMTGQSFPFLQLPTELRNKVYEFAITDTKSDNTCLFYKERPPNTAASNTFASNMAASATEKDQRSSQLRSSVSSKCVSRSVTSSGPSSTAPGLPSSAFALSLGSSLRLRQKTLPLEHSQRSSFRSTITTPQVTRQTCCRSCALEIVLQRSPSSSSAPLDLTGICQRSLHPRRPLLLLYRNGIKSIIISMRL
jgi:hypothetical protein